MQLTAVDTYEQSPSTQPSSVAELANQLDSLRTVSPQPESGTPGLGDKDDPKGETPKKSRPVNIKDGPKKQHKSCDEKS